MKLIGKSDLGASAKVNTDGTRIVLRLGPFAFVAARSEAIELAAQIVAAVDAMAQRDEA
jgi:hypothetical protein